LNGGGGLALFGNATTLTNCIISGNTGNNDGVGLWTSDSTGRSGATTLTNCTVSGNSTDLGRGGGLANASYQGRASMLTLANCTVSDNSAFEGGGVFNSTGSTTLITSNSILARNSATSSPDVMGALKSQGYNLIGDGNGGNGYTSTDQIGTQASPIDPRLGMLQDNGGPTQTMALLPGSPALNAGDPAQLGQADQRGVVRSGGVDIGAYQASASAFVLTAPATIVAGTPFNVTVTAVDPFGQTALGYTGGVAFTSADPYGATLPATYTFLASDYGTHTFIAGATLYTAGTGNVTATDMEKGSITGSVSIAITPAAADHLVFLQQPANTAAGQTITPAVLVAVVDPYGNLVTSDNSDTITLALGTNPSGSTLSGTLTLTVSGGLAAFSDLSIDVASDDYTLQATMTGVQGAQSSAFDIT
jgi:hypothetical protein